MLAACGRLGFDEVRTGTDGVIEVLEVEPRYVMPGGGSIEVTLAGDVEGAMITLDGAPCEPISSPSPSVLRCAASPHAAGVVPLVATAATGDSAELAGGFVYLTPGFYQLGGPLDDNTSGIAVDAEGAVYVSGATLGSLDGQNAGDFDALLVKYDPAGRVAWIRQLGTSQWDYARDVAIDPLTGDAVLVGYGLGDLDANGQPGGNDIFVARYSPAGDLRWLKQFGTSGDDQAWDLALDGSGSTSVSGWTDGSFPGATNAGGLDYVLLRIDPAGELVWARQVGTANDDHGHSVTAAADGTAYLAGYTGGVIEPGGTNAGLDDLFVARYDADGTRAWIRQRGSPASDHAQDVTLDAVGRPVVVGYTDGALDGNPSAGGRDIFMARFTSAGTWELTRQRGSPASESTWGVATDETGNIFVACVTGGAFDGEVNAGGQDLCLVTWRDDGSHAFTRLAGSTGSDSPSSCVFDAARSDLLYISLNSDGALDGSPNRGASDAAVAKFDALGTRL